MADSKALLALLNFKKLFEVDSNAWGVEIGTNPNPEEPFAFYSENQSKSRKKHSNCYNKFYEIVRSSDHCSYYIILNDFLFFISLLF